MRLTLDRTWMTNKKENVMGLGIGRIGEKYTEADVCPGAQREAEIPAAMQDIEKQITELHDEVRMLIEKIGPVMRNAQPVPDSPKNMRSIQSELGNILAQQSGRVESIADEVRDARNRLEI